MGAMATGDSHAAAAGVRTRADLGTSPASLLSWTHIEEWRESPHFLMDTILILIIFVVMIVVGWTKSKGGGGRGYLSLARDKSTTDAFRRLSTRGSRRARGIHGGDGDGEPRTVVVDAASAGLVGVSESSSENGIGHTVVVSGALDIELSSFGQHTVRWNASLGLAGMVVGSGNGGGAAAVPDADDASWLPPGECNLYHFPRVTFDTSPAHAPTTRLSGDRLEVLTRLVLAMNARPPPAVNGKEEAREDVGAAAIDASGALMVHSLAVANTNAATDACLSLLTSRPELIPAAHRRGMFSGETVLHALAINWRQADALALLEIAEAQLDDDALRTTLTAQATGDFFTLAPMRLYGSTPFAYLCAFGALDVLSHIFESRRLAKHVKLNDPSSACPLSGLLPLHVAAAHDRMGVYDLLLAKGADPEALICAPLAPLATHVPEGSPLGEEAPSLTGSTALQLSCLMGHTATAAHIIKSRRELLYRWGGVSNWQLDLRHVDSVTDDLSVMDLVCKEDMPKSTHQMLLDDFMNG
jgi:hypothetical protein